MLGLRPYLSYTKGESPEHRLAYNIKDHGIPCRQIPLEVKAVWETRVFLSISSWEMLAASDLDADKVERAIIRYLIAVDCHL